MPDYNELRQLIKASCGNTKTLALEKAAEGQREIILLFEETGASSKAFSRDALQSYGKSMQKIGDAKGRLGVIAKIESILDSFSLASNDDSGPEDGHFAPESC